VTVPSNREIVESIYAAWEKGDWSSSEWADPDIRFEMVGGLTEGSWRGRAEMSEAWAALLRAWEDLSAVPDEIRALDDERILVLLRNHGRGKVSGIEVTDISAKSANLFTIRDGKVTELVLYWDRDRAFADLGLEAE
jgi:ketosteroid isomerase-like protein